MEYRIKVITKHSGENTYIPQYREDDWSYWFGIKLIFSPFILIMAMLSAKSSIQILNDWYKTWKEIHYDKQTFKEMHYLFMDSSSTAICDSMENARRIIRAHQKGYEDELEKEKQKGEEIRMKSTKKTTYIKVK